MVWAAAATIMAGSGIAWARAGKPDVRVVVTASRSDATLEQMPLYTTVISAEQIRQSPAQTLDQLLRQVPGINLTGAPYFTTDPMLASVRAAGEATSILEASRLRHEQFAHEFGAWTPTQG